MNVKTPSDAESDAALDALRRFASSRAAVRAAGSELALGLDKCWEAARVAPQGPVDVVDMFAGCGGMSAGFMAVNALMPAYRLAMAVDIDQLAMETYKTNLGVEPTKLDLQAYATCQADLVKLVNAARREPSAPLVLIGCAPCQGFSSHRNDAGEDDPRNTLFVTFAKAAAAIKPDAVIVENVPEVVTDRYWPVVREGRRILEKAGYHVLLTAHDMAEFGVPQHRFRAVMIGMRRPFNMPRGFLSGGARRTVRQAIGNLTPVRPGEVCTSDPMHFTAAHKASTVETIKAVPQDGGSRPAHVGPNCLRKYQEENGKAAYEDVYGRLAWDRPAITITGHARNPASGRYVHPEQHRGLSVREAALLQGFPSSWQFKGGLSPCFLQVGNAVPPPFAAFLAMHMLGEMFGEPAERVDRALDIASSLGKSFSRIIPALKAGHRRLHGESAA